MCKLRPVVKTASTTHAYASSWDLLRDELTRLDLLIRLQLLRQRNNQPPGPLDQFKGLVLTETEIAGLLMGLASNRRWPARCGGK